MKLQGQASTAQDGYAMAVLIVALGVMTILWTAALPVWNQLARREKEEELIFRGSQYARAIGLFQRKYANATPPSVDVLIQQHFLRRKYKDPMAADGQFQLLYQTPQQPGSPAGQPQGRGVPAAQSPVTITSPTAQGRGVTTGGAGGLVSTTTQQTSGGIIGVASKSKEVALRVYNGRTHYNEWQFIYLRTTQQPGAAAGGAGAGPTFGRGAGPASGAPGGAGGPGGRGGRGDDRGGPEGPGRGTQSPAGPDRGGFQFPPRGTVTPPIQLPPPTGR